MRATRFDENNPVQRRAKAAEIRSIVVSMVGFYQHQYELAKIAPGGARWRELRFSFKQASAQAYFPITVDELWDYLFFLIKQGIVKEYQTIFQPRYELDYAALRAYERKWNLT